jgi:hypothetical protein
VINLARSNNTKLALVLHGFAISTFLNRKLTM